MYTISTKIIDCLAKGVRILHGMKCSLPQSLWTLGSLKFSLVLVL